MRSLFSPHLTKQRLLVRCLLSRDPRGYPEAELLAGGRLGDQPDKHCDVMSGVRTWAWSPVKIGRHGDQVITDNEASSEELIGDPVSRVLANKIRGLMTVANKRLGFSVTFDGWNSKRMSFSSLFVFLILSTKLIVLWFSGMFSSFLRT